MQVDTRAKVVVLLLGIEFVREVCCMESTLVGVGVGR